MEDLYFEVLEALCNGGIENDVDISELMIKRFSTAKEVGDLVWSNRANTIIAYLNILKKNGHIDYVYKHFEHEIHKGWVVPVHVTGKITFSGVDYYYEHKLKTATINSLANQFRYNLITWILATFAILISGYSIIQKDEISTELVHLKQEMQQLKYQQHLKVAIYKTGDTILKK